MNHEFYEAERRQVKREKRASLAASSSNGISHPDGAGSHKKIPKTQTINARRPLPRRGEQSQWGNKFFFLPERADVRARSFTFPRFLRRTLRDGERNDAKTGWSCLRVRARACVSRRKKRLLLLLLLCYSFLFSSSSLILSNFVLFCFCWRGVGRWGWQKGSGGGGGGGIEGCLYHGEEWLGES